MLSTRTLWYEFHNLKMPVMWVSGHLSRGTLVYPGLASLGFCCPECYSLDLLGVPRFWLLWAHVEMGTLVPEQGQQVCPPGQLWGRAGLLAKDLFILPPPGDTPSPFLLSRTRSCGFFQSGGSAEAVRDPQSRSRTRGKPWDSL